jgi:hypothetical protein
MGFAMYLTAKPPISFFITSHRLPTTIYRDSLSDLYMKAICDVWKE